VLPDGRLASGSSEVLLTGCNKEPVRLWDVTTGAEAARLEGHTKPVTALVMLPDGRLASGSNDCTVRLWDVKAGTETTCLEGHSSGISALATLPDGRLASSSWDNTIRLWDVMTGAELCRLEVDAPVLCVIALSDKYLVAGDGMGRLHWLDIVG
jgi:WD40 repeat protein